MEMETYRDLVRPMHAFDVKQVDEENFKATIAISNPNLQVFTTEDHEDEADLL